MGPTMCVQRGILLVAVLAVPSGAFAQFVIDPSCYWDQCVQRQISYDFVHGSAIDYEPPEGRPPLPARVEYDEGMCLYRLDRVNASSGCGEPEIEEYYFPGYHRIASRTEYYFPLIPESCDWIFQDFFNPSLTKIYQYTVTHIDEGNPCADTIVDSVSETQIAGLIDENLCYVRITVDASYYGQRPDYLIEPEVRQYWCETDWLMQLEFGTDGVELNEFWEDMYNACLNSDCSGGGTFTSAEPDYDLEDDFPDLEDEDDPDPEEPEPDDPDMPGDTDLDDEYDPDQDDGEEPDEDFETDEDGKEPADEGEEPDDGVGPVPEPDPRDPGTPPTPTGTRPGTDTRAYPNICGTYNDILGICHPLTGTCVFPDVRGYPYHMWYTPEGEVYLFIGVDDDRELHHLLENYDPDDEHTYWIIDYQRPRMDVWDHWIDSGIPCGDPFWETGEHQGYAGATFEGVEDGDAVITGDFSMRASDVGVALGGSMGSVVGGRVVNALRGWAAEREQPFVWEFEWPGVVTVELDPQDMRHSYRGIMGKIIALLIVFESVFAGMRRIINFNKGASD